jgi:hypothetical protein
MHLIGYLYEDYHDAGSLEHKVPYHSFQSKVSTYECCLIVCARQTFKSPNLLLRSPGYITRKVS